MSDLLLQTKLFKPALRPSLINRNHLVDRLNGSLDNGLSGFAARLSLVSAPAGFGKTTLVSAWLAQLTAVKTAWLSLDENDNDPIRFLTYLIAALQTAEPALGETAVRLLQSPQPPAAETILTLLINDLSLQSQPILLILDDYHSLTNPAIHQALAFLLDNQPTSFHLLLTTRSDPPLPLSRMRARSQLVEIRAGDLRFTTSEASQFLIQVMGLSLSAEALAALEQRTEGWIAGLQLAALAMQSPTSWQGHDDLSGFVAAFTGSHRFVLDYLTDEVLERRPKGTEDFLLKISILDRFCGPLCNAITGRSDGQAVLEQLDQANFFIIPLDDERYWYRYHHLFEDFLRYRFQRSHPDNISRLYQTASSWCEENGLLEEAVQYALKSQNFTQAAYLIEEVGPAIAFQGRYQTVLGWLADIPEDVIAAFPMLSIYQAAMRIFTGDLETAERNLQNAERVATAVSSPDKARVILGNAATLWADIYRIKGDLENCFSMTQKALALIPGPTGTPLDLSATAKLDIARTYRLDGDVNPEREQLAESVIPAIIESGNSFATLNSITNLANLQALQGRLNQARQTFGRVSEIFPQPELLHTLFGNAFYYIGLGDLLRRQNELDTAESLLEEGVALANGATIIEADVIAWGHAALALLRQARGDSNGANELMVAFASLAQRRSIHARVLNQMRAIQAELWLAQGNLEAASRWADSLALTQSEIYLAYNERHVFTLARLRLLQHRANPNENGAALLIEIEGLLEEPLAVAKSSNRGQSVIEILLLRALILQEKGDIQDALVDLAQAIALAAPENCYRVFLDMGQPMAELLQQARQHGLQPAFVDSLQATFSAGESRPLGEDLLPDPLSEREVEVLHLMATGAPNKEIAERLFITVSTVKKHVGNILVKLDASNRVEAAARARKLDLIT